MAKVKDLVRGSDQTLSVITRALRTFSETIPDQAVSKISFTHEPDVDDSTWGSVVTLSVFGALTRQTGDNTGVLSLEPQLITTIQWAGQGPNYSASVTDLAANVESYLTSEVALRRSHIEMLTDALTDLHSSGLSTDPTIWPTEDNPIDDPPEEIQSTD